MSTRRGGRRRGSRLPERERLQDPSRAEVVERLQARLQAGRTLRTGEPPLHVITGGGVPGALLAIGAAAIGALVLVVAWWWLVIALAAAVAVSVVLTRQRTLRIELTAEHGLQVPGLSGGWPEQLRGRVVTLRPMRRRELAGLLAATKAPGVPVVGEASGASVTGEATRAPTVGEVDGCRVHLGVQRAVHDPDPTSSGDPDDVVAWVALASARQQGILLPAWGGRQATYGRDLLDAAWVPRERAEGADRDIPPQRADRATVVDAARATWRQLALVVATAVAALAVVAVVRRVIESATVELRIGSPAIARLLAGVLDAGLFAAVFAAAAVVLIAAVAVLVWQVRGRPVTAVEALQLGLRRAPWALWHLAPVVLALAAAVVTPGIGRFRPFTILAVLLLGWVPAAHAVWALTRRTWGEAWTSTPPALVAPEASRLIAVLVVTAAMAVLGWFVIG